MAQSAQLLGLFLPELPRKQKEDLADAAEQNEENVPSDPRRQPFCYSVLGRWLLVVELCALVGLGNCVNLAGYVGNWTHEVPWKTFQW